MSEEHDTWLEGIGVKVTAYLDIGDDEGLTIEVSQTLKALKAKIWAAQASAENAMDSYEDQMKINGDQWFVSAFANLGTKDPGPELTLEVNAAKAAAAKATAAADTGDFAKAGDFLAESKAAADRAAKIAQAFTGDLISGAETAETGIKVVDTGAKIVGAVALTVATAGAGAAVVAGTAAASGTAAAGVATATTISVVGGMAASGAGALTKAAIGDKVDWGMVSIDILMQGLLARFGGNLSNGLMAAVAKRLGPSVSTAIIKNVVTQAVMHVDSTILKTALESIYQKVSGKDITWQKVIDSLVAQLTDPSVLAVAAASAAAGGSMDAKALPSGTSTPEPNIAKWTVGGSSK